ncbi:MupG family TIM beta-alpha barrel fold protein [Enterococcus casseliflavus]|uniref:MupG family TIM beta-alpha barrel fold protein n=1 Tax=Enterococcus casseliflavus TaxID=37734 RepID=UPI001883C3DA|nr:MupG family TIM beta-alpha barrel fold protein [Enterococcus casseliflavus]MBE9909312.1 DUF871 domain-containing protein [Enterococcus casseliflavus]
MKTTKNLGISVYPDLRKQEEIKEYMELASKYGCKRVFSSMFNVEGDNDEVLNCFKQLIDNAHDFGLQVSLDVNPECFRRFGAGPEDLSVFDDLGVDILRLDVDNGVEDDIKLINNPYGIAIEFNGSALPVSTIIELISRGVDPKQILVCHNFYPQRYTGMKWKTFVEINAQLKELGVRVGAFVSSNAKNSHGVWGAIHGLPTVEQHRGKPIDLQLREIFLNGAVDTIFIGNAYATEEEFRKIAEVMQNIKPDEEKHPIIKIKRSYGNVADDQFYPQHKIKINTIGELTDVEREILFNYFPHSDVGDGSEWIWRSRMPRFLYSKIGVEVRQHREKQFEPGTVVVVNNNYRHYAGEVQVVLRPIENDGTRNIVGYLDNDEFSFFKKIPDREVVVFLVGR